MAEEPELTDVAGPHAVGVTLHLVGDVNIYVGMPPPEGCDRLTAQDAERHACRTQREPCARRWWNWKPLRAPTSIRSCELKPSADRPSSDMARPELACDLSLLVMAPVRVQS